MIQKQPGIVRYEVRENEFGVSEIESLRLIPILGLIDGSAVITKNFDNPRYVGDPINTTEILSKFEADELLVCDFSERFSKPRTRVETLAGIVDMASMPISYSGGIETLDRAKELFNLGFDKLGIRVKFESLNLIDKVASNFGSQAALGVIDYSENDKGYLLNGIQVGMNELENYLQAIVNAGVGELLLHSIDRQGTRSGLNFGRIEQFFHFSSTFPVILAGGADTVENILQLSEKHNIEAIAAATLFTLNQTRDSVFINYTNYNARREFLE